MRREHAILVLTMFLVFIAISYVALKYSGNSKNPGTDLLTGKSALVPAKEMQKEKPKIVTDDGSLDVTFCPRENCSSYAEHQLRSAQTSVHCAFYDFRLDNLISALGDASTRGVDVKVVVDDANTQYIENASFAFKTDPANTMMHNKFCIIDGRTVLTGSFNPTSNCAFKNNNNFIVVNSPVLAKQYSAEFDEMWSGRFSSGMKSERELVVLPNISLEVYFCPDDGCEAKLNSLLANANSSIYFMTFSFTLDSSKDILIQKYRSGLTVEGVFEKQQLSDWDIYDGLLLEGLPVMLDTNKYKLHHKVFIIDNSTIVTGSMNPTNNGVKHNDENMLIIYDKEGSIARRFIEEFAYVYPDKI